MIVRGGKRGADVGLSTRRGEAFLAVAFPVTGLLVAAALPMTSRATDAQFIKL
jgi:hypothetical protein